MDVGSAPPLRMMRGFATFVRFAPDLPSPDWLFP
jgi:hypothetical protein